MGPRHQDRRINLELDADPNPIQGTLEDGDGGRERFWGRLGLTAALERANDGVPGEQDGERRHSIQKEQR
jgi:hypothetical protein